MKWIWMIPIAFSISLLITAQGEDKESVKITRLIKELGAKDFDKRNKALSELINIGTSAIPYLKKTLKETNDPEVQARISFAIEEIKKKETLKEVCKQAGLINLSVKDALLSDVINQIERQSGLKIDTLGMEKDIRITLELKNDPILKVLDLICIKIKDIRYEWEKKDYIKLVRGKFINYPSTYNNSYKLSITRLKMTIDENFKERKRSLDLWMRAFWEEGVKPLECKLEEIKVISDDEKELEVKRAFGHAIQGVPGMVQVVIGGGGRVRNQEKEKGIFQFHISDLPSNIKKLKRIECKLSFMYPIMQKEVKFSAKRIKRKMKKQEDGMSIELKWVSKYGWQRPMLVVKSSKSLTIKDGLLVARDKRDKEYNFILTGKRNEGGKQIFDFNFQGGWMPFGQFRRSKLTEVKFTLVELYEKPIRFILNDVVLP
jgi:hypothetical protein